jgi:hypothetical protein
LQKLEVADRSGRFSLPRPGHFVQAQAGRIARLRSQRNHADLSLHGLGVFVPGLEPLADLRRAKWTVVFRML